MGWIALIVFIIVLIIIVNIYLTKKKKERLLGKYGDPEIVEMIMQHCFWVGQTEEQLIDSLGIPEGKSVKKMKTRYREVWKYNQMGKNRYGLRITLDDRIVQTWERK